jgi:hypothetical protein
MREYVPQMPHNKTPQWRGFGDRRTYIISPVQTQQSTVIVVSEQVKPLVIVQPDRVGYERAVVTKHQNALSGVKLIVLLLWVVNVTRVTEWWLRISWRRWTSYWHHFSIRSCHWRNLQSFFVQVAIKLRAIFPRPPGSVGDFCKGVPCRDQQ